MRSLSCPLDRKRCNLAISAAQLQSYGSVWGACCPLRKARRRSLGEVAVLQSPPQALKTPPSVAWFPISQERGIAPFHFVDFDLIDRIVGVSPDRPQDKIRSAELEL